MRSERNCSHVLLVERPVKSNYKHLMKEFMLDRSGQEREMPVSILGVLDGIFARHVSK